MRHSDTSECKARDAQTNTNSVGLSKISFVMYGSRDQTNSVENSMRIVYVVNEVSEMIFKAGIYVVKRGSRQL